MNKEKLLEYIEKKGELNFFEEINNLNPVVFDDSARNIIDALMFLINRDSVQFGSARLSFFKTASKVLPYILSKNMIGDFVDIIRQNATENFVNMASITGRFILNIKVSALRSTYFLINRSAVVLRPK